KLDWKIQGAIEVPFDLPVPGVYSSGKIAGRVVLVGNGAADHENGPLDRLVVKAGRTRVSADEEGRFEFPPLSPGRYEVEIENLPINYVPLAPSPFEAIVNAGRVTSIEIPVA